MGSMKSAFNLPYPRAYNKLLKLAEKPGKDVEKTPYAILTSIFTPVLAKIYSIDIKRQTDTNALLAAIDIYIIKAKTGKLPDALPAGLPKDLFSDKDFLYEKTADGFILRCQGKDLGKDKIYDYESKVKN